LTTKNTQYIGICGWKNSGKTTLINQLIPLFLAKGKTVGVIKHTHHSVSLDKPQTDSYLYREHGASTSLLVTDKGWAMAHTASKTPSLEQMIALMKEQIILIEGFKQEPHPKIEVYADNQDREIGALSWPSVVAVTSENRPSLLPPHIPWYERQNLNNLVALIEEKAFKINS
jgi:molybdopterin-guanine dinucleotide biosynthesis protein MobB